jgi:hypothetical protein
LKSPTKAPVAPTGGIAFDVNDEHDKPKIGEQVILLALPPGLLAGLPEEDQRAITSMVGRPVTLVGYDEDGRAELAFDNPFEPRSNDSSHTHSIWVAREFIAPVQP